MGSPGLTSGCLQTIMSSAEFEGEPVLQVLAIKEITWDGAETYQLCLSDGRYLGGFSMLSPQLDHMVTNGELNEYTIIKINQHIITWLVNKNDNDKRRRVLIIDALEVVKPGEEVGRKVGDPVVLNEANKQGARNPTESDEKPER